MSKRKAYHPRPVHLNAVQRAMEASALLPAADRTNLLNIAQGAFNDLRFGRNCAEAWRNLADAFNVAEALSAGGICSDADSVATFVEAQRALGALHEQQRASNGWTLHAWQICAFDEALFRHQVQLQNCSLREYQRARDLVRRRIAAALAGNAGRSVEVLMV